MIQQSQEEEEEEEEEEEKKDRPCIERSFITEESSMLISDLASRMMAGRAELKVISLSRSLSYLYNLVPDEYGREVVTPEGEQLLFSIV